MSWCKVRVSERAVSVDSHVLLIPFLMGSGPAMTGVHMHDQPVLAYRRHFEHLSVQMTG